MSEYSFKEAAERAAANVEAPKPFPAGLWRFRINGGKAKEITGAGDKAPVWKALYPCTPIEPIENVSDDELQVYGDYTEATVYHEIPVFRKDDEWKIKRFHAEILGQTDMDGVSITGLPETGRGHEFVGEVFHDYVEGREDPLTKIKNVVAVEV